MMSRNMREEIVIAVAQPRCVSLDVAANALAHAAAIRGRERPCGGLSRALAHRL